MKAYHQGKQRKKTLIKLAVLFAVAAGFFFFLSMRKDVLVEQSVRVLESFLKQGTDLTFKIDKISGNFLGSIRFKNITISQPWLPKEKQILMRADEIQFHYRLLDFISKKQLGKFRIHVTRPEVFIRPSTGIRGPRFPFMGWMREWALSQAGHLSLRVEDMTMHYGADKEIHGVDLFYENKKFEALVPISHLELQAIDISTELRFDGEFQLGAAGQPDQLTGSIRTENTILNWKPLPSEMDFHYIFTPSYFRFDTINFLGGIEINGEIDFTKDYALNISARAANYPLLTLDSFFSISGAMNESSRLDLEAHLEGSPWEPRLEARARISEGWVKKRAFKAMEVNVEGVYPTLKLTESRVFLQDGQTMRFADTTLEFKDLFRGKTYEALISQAQQETFVLGDWQFSRPRDKNDQPEFLLQKAFGDQAKVHLRKFNEEDKIIVDHDPNDEKPTDLEVGFEYRLRTKDSLKFHVKNDEEFMGIERKVSF